MVNLPSEHDEQVAFCKWLAIRKIPFAAVPNGGKRGIVSATRLKAEGVKRGFPDLLIFLPNGVNVALELKARSGGRVSPEQREWGQFFGERPGWKYILALGAGEAIKAIEAYCSVIYGNQLR